MDLAHAVTVTDGGYVVEMRVPLAELGFTPAPGVRAGLLVANDDVDGGELTAWAWGGTYPFKDPREWGVLRLGGSHCTEPAAPAVPDAPPAMTRPGNELGPIGGGAGYTDMVDATEAQIVVRTLAELRGALEVAGRGDIVYVDDAAEIDLGRSKDVRIPAGVVLASGRGRDGSEGALLYTDDFNVGTVFVAGAGVRLTGLRLRGPHVGFFEPKECKPRGCSPNGCGVAWSYDAVGLEANHDDIEIDNVEISGWTYAGISISKASPHIHHSAIFGNAMVGLGYGITGCGGKPVIEYNYFNENRHSIAECGSGGYVARFNHHGPKAVGHVFDVHPDGGRTTIIHNNTVEATEDHCGNRLRNVYIRGVPSDTCDVYQNWFHVTHESTVYQSGGGSKNMRVYDNHFGPDTPPDSIGAPR